MNNTPDKTTFSYKLRKKAEELLKNKPSTSRTHLSEADSLRLMHELEVHQVELDMQAEELRVAQIAAQEVTDLYDFDPTAYFTLSREGKIRGLNLSAANLLHASRSGLKGKKFEQFITSDTKSFFTSFLKNVYLNHGKESCEIMITNPGSESSFVYLTGTLDKNNEFCLVTAINTTELRQNDEILRQEREFYADILNNQPAGIYRIRVFKPEKWWKNAWNTSVNPPYKMELANDRFCDILGITREEFETNPEIISDLIHLEDLPEFVRKNEEANSKIIPFKWEGRLVVHQKICWVHLESFPRSQESGEILWTGILYDVSEQKKLVEDLTESETKYRELVDNSPDAICIYSNGKIVFVNKESLKLIAAKNPNELIGKKAIELVHPDYRSLALERMLKIASEQDVQPLTEQKFIRFDGTTVEVEVKAMPIVYQQKQAVQLIMRDITERKKIEDELQSSREEFKDLFENAPVGYHEIDANGRIVKINHTETEMLGYMKEELIGKYIWDITGDKVYSMHVTLEKLKGKQISSTPYERDFIKKDGTKITVLIQDKILNSVDGTKITGNRSSVQDITERKESEVNLQLSEEKFRNIFENSVMGKSMTNMDGTMNVNKAFCQITGYSKEELSRIHWSKLTYKDDIEPSQHQLEKILTGEKAFAYWEKRYIHKKGPIVWVDICTFMLRDKDGKPVHFITEIYDITERKKSEEALRESEERYKSISENSKSGILIMDIHGKIEWANKHTTVLLGYGEKQILEADSFSSFVAKESLGFIESNYQAMVDKKPFRHQFQLTVVRSDGEKRVCEKFMTNFTDRYGVLKIITVITDVTERIKAEEELKTSEKKHRQIIETAMDGFWIVNTEGEILEVNDAYIKMSGYNKAELLKMHISDLECIENKNEIKKHMQSIITHGQDLFETRHRRKDGSIIDVEICVQFQSATTKLLISFIRNITERKFVEKALMESEIKFRNLFNNTPIPIMYVNNYGEITHRNKKFIELLGYDEQEVSTLNDWWQKAYPSESYRKTVVGNWNKTVRKFSQTNEDIENAIYQVTCKDGVERDIIISASQFANNYLTTFVDVTEQKKAEKTLNESKEMLRKLLFTSSELIDSGDNKLDYQRMTDIIIEISGAKYASFNMMEENSNEFTTVAISGMSDIQYKASSILGFNPMNKKWKNDPNRAAKISQDIITRFETLRELTGAVISSKIISIIENTFQLGEINVVKITKNNKLIGDFTLFFTKDSSLQNQEIVELFVNSLGLFFERKIAIELLRTSEEKYRYLFANNPQPMWIFDLKTLEFLEINQAAIDLYGYTREEFLSMTIREIRPPEEVSKILKSVKTSSEEFNSVGEWRHTKKNGDIIIVDVTVVPVVSTGRKARHVMVQDITERKQAEEALKESEDKYRTMIENSNDIIWTLDQDAKFTFLNDKALSITGIVQEEWIGKSFLPLAMEGELPMLMNIFVRTMDGESCSYELLFKVAEDNIRTIQTNTSPIMIEGKVVGVVSFGRDITEQKSAEKALRGSEDLYRNLVQKIPDGVYKSTSDGKFVDVNPAMVQLLGYESKEELMDIDIKSQLYFDATDRESMVLKEAVDGNGVFQMKKKDGSAIWVEDHGWFRTDDFENIIYHEGVIRDITESKKALQMLQDSEEKFRSIAEQTDDLISITDEYGMLEYASPASLSIFQYTPEEVKGHYFTDFMDEASVARARAAFAKSAETGVSVNSLELKMKRKDGSLFYAELSGSRFNYNTKNGTLVVVRDISERKEAQEELEERMVELVRFNRLTVDRELNMIQLKKEVNELLQQTGKDGKYKIVM